MSGSYERRRTRPRDERRGCLGLMRGEGLNLPGRLIAFTLILVGTGWISWIAFSDISSPGPEPTLSSPTTPPTQMDAAAESLPETPATPNLVMPTPSPAPTVANEKVSPQRPTRVAPTTPTTEKINDKLSAKERGLQEILKAAKIPFNPNLIHVVLPLNDVGFKTIQILEVESEASQDNIKRLFNDKYNAVAVSYTGTVDPQTNLQNANYPKSIAVKTGYSQTIGFKPLAIKNPNTESWEIPNSRYDNTQSFSVIQISLKDAKFGNSIPVPDQLSDVVEGKTPSNFVIKYLPQ